MELLELNDIANATIATGKGVLAADESADTIRWRFLAVDEVRIRMSFDSGTARLGGSYSDSYLRGIRPH